MCSKVSLTPLAAENTPTRGGKHPHSRRKTKTLKRPVERLRIFDMREGVHLCVLFCVHGTSRNTLFTVLCIGKNIIGGRIPATIVQSTRKNNWRRDVGAYVLSFVPFDLLSSLQKRVFLYDGGPSRLSNSKEVA
jgi:hypothetical protein